MKPKAGPDRREADTTIDKTVIKSLALGGAPQEQAIAPVGESKSDYEAVLEIASKLGMADVFSENKFSGLDHIQKMCGPGHQRLPGGGDQSDPGHDGPVAARLSGCFRARL